MPSVLEALRAAFPDVSKDAVVDGQAPAGQPEVPTAIKERQADTSGEYSSRIAAIKSQVRTNVTAWLCHTVVYVLLHHSPINVAAASRHPARCRTPTAILADATSRGSQGRSGSSAPS